jgi:cobaltochelatase CobS
MMANYESTCCACGGKIMVGEAMERSRQANSLWVHSNGRCDSPLPDRKVHAWRELGKLRGPRLRKAAMAVGATVTANGKYVSDMEVLARAIGQGVSEQKVDAAVALATGVGQLGQPAPQPAPANSPVDAAKLAEQVKGIIGSWLDGRGEEAAKRLGDDLERRLEEALAKVTRTELVVRSGDREVVLEGLQHSQFPQLLRMVGAGLNVWVAGPAGSGKTRAASDAARALGLKFHFNGAIDSEYKLSGFVDAQGRVVSTAFREAWTKGGLYLFDEVDASMPSALLAFNAALSGDLADFPGEPDPVKRHPDFRVVAAANTWGFGGDGQYVGRSKLDAAFLDRFASLPWDYDEALEKKMAGQHERWADTVQEMRRLARARGLKVVISPRATLAGAAMLAAGFSQREAAEATVLCKLDPGSRQALEGAVRL